MAEFVCLEKGKGFNTQLQFKGPYPSGAPAIFIDQCGRIGASAAMVGMVGNDDFGYLNINRLKKDGLNFTSNRIAKTWFVKKDKSKYFYLCDEAGKSTTLKAADSALKAMENWNGLENLKNIKNPTLIIWGKKDKAYNFNQVDSLNKNIPSNEMVIFKDCSHNVHLENPDEFNMCVDKFLNKKKLNYIYELFGFRFFYWIKFNLSIRCTEYICNRARFKKTICFFSLYSLLHI